VQRIIFHRSPKLRPTPDELKTKASALYIKMGGEADSAALRYNMVRANPASGLQ
jgi:hypothetical protein